MIIDKITSFIFVYTASFFSFKSANHILAEHGISTEIMDLILGPFGALVVTVIAVVWLFKRLKDRDAKIDELHKDLHNEQEDQVKKLEEEVRALRRIKDK